MKRVASGILPLIAVSRSSLLPLHKQIYEAYRAAVIDGRLRPGQKIPSTRSLAQELRISRFPVLNAYSQLLAEGYFQSKIGAGTVVSGTLPEQFMLSAAARSSSRKKTSSPRPISRNSALLPQQGALPWLRGIGPFGVGQVAFDHFPHQLWSALIAKHARRIGKQSGHYGDQMGAKALREAVAAYLRAARSVRCEADQVMIVSGSQQALEVSARAVLDPGSHVWIEDPGYKLARDVFTLAGCRLVPVPVDEEGLDPAAGIESFRKARAAFVTPSHQFPLGVTMSAARRFQLLEWAESSGAWIIEDDYDSEYRYESLPIASLQGMDAHGRVIYIGTFSKVLFPALRLGYIVIPADLVGGFLAIRRAMDLGPATFPQEVLAEFISDGHFARHIRRMRMLYQERRSQLVACLKKEFGDEIEVLGSEAGMHLAVIWKKGIRDGEVATRAAQQGLWMWPLSRAYLGKPAARGLILGFGSAPAEDIPQAIRKLRSVIDKR